MGKSARTENQVRKTCARIPEILGNTRGCCDANLLAAELLVPWKVADLALREFALQYDCRIDVSQSKEKTQYAFQLPLRRRPGFPTLQRQLRAILGGGFRGIIQVSLVGLLLLYGLIYLGALAALAQGNLQEAIGWRRSENNNWKFWWKEILKFNQDFASLVAGSRIRLGEPSSMMENIYTFLAKNGGVMTCADVMALSGCAYKTADNFMTWLMLVDKGSVRVTEDGLLIYIFPEFRRDLRHKHKRSGWIWQQPQVQSGIFNVIRNHHHILLFIGLSFSGAAFTNIWMLENGIHEGLAKTLLADVPLWLSIACMAIPLARWAVSLARHKIHRINRLQVDVLRVLHDDLRPYSLIEDLTSFVERSQSGTVRQLREYASLVLRSIGGALTVDKSNNEAIDAPTLRDEWTLSVIARDRILAGTAPPGEPVGLANSPD